MKSNWKHINFEQRKTISSSIKHNFKLIQIAKLLDLDPTSISKEVKRNDMKDFKNYIESDKVNMKEHVTSIQYGYGLTPNIYKIDDDKVIVGSGAKNAVLSKNLIENSLTGFEFASGIPGTIAGAVKMNAGAYGREIKDVVVSSTYMDKLRKYI